VIWFFGGVAALSRESDNPGDEFKISSAGPLSSFGIGGVLFALAVGLESLHLDNLLVSSILWLGIVNIVLAMFNLLPVFPMDGGRMFFAGLWACLHDRIRAMKVAAGVGQVFAAAMIGLGFALILFGDRINILNGVWFVLIGWILYTAAKMELEQAMFKHRYVFVYMYAWTYM
jgi:Zn-dependent protease